eukprot:gene29802-38954_t
MIHAFIGIITCSFCDIIPSLWSYFAAAGGRSVTIFSIDNDDSLRTVKTFTSQDKSEEYYTCQVPMISFAGFRGIITVLSLDKFQVRAVLVGHGGPVNHLCVHPLTTHLLFSASNDRSIRMWNLDNGVCIAIFAGEQGHINEVLTIDIHSLGNCFVSGGMDTCVKVWNLQDPLLLLCIAASSSSSPSSSATKKDPSLPCFQQIPLYSTVDVHSGYVDSVRWVGDAVLSKSTGGRVVLWEPGAALVNPGGVILQEFALPSGETWFVKLDACIPLDMFAVGNSWGQVFVYPLSTFKNKYPEVITKRSQYVTGVERFQCEQPCQPSLTLFPSHTSPTRQVIVRQTAFSAHGQYLACGLDGGLLHVWKIAHN